MRRLTQSRIACAASIVAGFFLAGVLTRHPEASPPVNVFAIYPWSLFAVPAVTFAAIALLRRYPDTRRVCAITGGILLAGIVFHGLLPPVALLCGIASGAVGIALLSRGYLADLACLLVFFWIVGFPANLPLLPGLALAIFLAGEHPATHRMARYVYLRARQSTR